MAVNALPALRQGQGQADQPLGSSARCPSAKLGTAFTIAYGGIAARVPANKIGKLLAVPGVVAVQKDTLNQPQDDNTSFLGATNVWPTLGGQDNAGSNVVVGVIDTGVWPESPMIRRRPASRLRRTRCRSTTATSVTARTSAHLGPTFACNNKLIGAYNFTADLHVDPGLERTGVLQQHDAACARRATPRVTARTRRRRPPATASTSAVLYGVDRGPVSGIAPGAHVDHVPRLPRRAAASAPTRCLRCSRRSRTAST